MMLNKTGYMHVAVTSEDFLQAAKSAVVVMTDEVPVIAVLNGAQAVFTILGVGIVSSVPASLTYLVCITVPGFSSVDSIHFIEFPTAVALASAIFNAIIGASFMVVFDTVGDAILYYFALEEQGMLIENTEGHDSEASEDSGAEPGYFGWLFGSTDETDLKEKVRKFERQMQFAPAKLRNLIEEHKAKHGLS
mmetsp:Transcript_7015/g.16594  ORF Transcript_7015/g.16594 Transcript_7015/m.16594 type:complete len:192 (+) Transcript_7015:271-846(+)